jgi:hypothetical protein
MSDPLALMLPPETLEAIAQRVAELLRPVSPWMTRREASEYLHLPLSRLQKDRSIPCHRDGHRVLYNRQEVDSYFLGLPYDAGGDGKAPAGGHTPGARQQEVES